jgi:hypothetical protein
MLFTSAWAYGRVYRTMSNVDAMSPTLLPDATTGVPDLLSRHTLVEEAWILTRELEPTSLEISKTH